MPDAQVKNDPTIFSRGSLKLTFDLIRKKEPQIALDIRNITNGQALPKDAADINNKNSDFFRIKLDSFQIRAIVEALVIVVRQQQATSVSGSDNSGVQIMAKALIDDWMALASKMFTELPDDQKPS